MLPDAGTAALRSNTELECLFRGNESNRSVVVAAYSDPGKLDTMFRESRIHRNCSWPLHAVPAVLPLMPSNPQVIIHHDVRNVVITLAWEAPRGEGPEAVVDHYIISLSPSPLSPMDTMVLASPWNVTLNSNEVLTATIVAVNCNGESDPLVFDVITGAIPLLHLSLCNANLQISTKIITILSTILYSTTDFVWDLLVYGEMGGGYV